MDREAWHAAVHGITKSWTRMSDWTELTNGPDPLGMYIWIISSGKEPVLYIIMLNVVILFHIIYKSNIKIKIEKNHSALSSE